MYTYDGFEKLGVFTLLQPIFITILIVSMLLFLTIVIPRYRNKFINGSTVIGMSVPSILIAGQLLFFSGIIVDEIGLGGDAVSFFLFIGIAGLGIINISIYFKKAKKGN